MENEKMSLEEALEKLDLCKGYVAALDIARESIRMRIEAENANVVQMKGSGMVIETLRGLVEKIDHYPDIIHYYDKTSDIEGKVYIDELPDNWGDEPFYRPIRDFFGKYGDYKLLDFSMELDNGDIALNVSIKKP